MRYLFLLLTMLALVGCASPSLPPGYSGPTATLQDTFQMRGFSRSDFFMVSKVNGRRVDTSEALTKRKNYGNGLNMYPEALTHTIAAGTVELEITGRTVDAAPILTLVRKNWEVTGTVRIEAASGHTYVVKGVLNEKDQAVWLVDSESGSIVSEIIVAPKSDL